MSGSALRIGITTFGGDGGRSGISKYICSLLREFDADADGVEYEVLVWADEREVFVPNGGRLETVSLAARSRTPLRNIAWHQVALPLWCRKRAYDVLFLPAANRRLPFSVPCRTVGTVHDLACLHVAHKYDRWRTVYGTRVLPALIRRLDHVLTPSESSRADIIGLAGVPDAKVTVTPLAADRRRFFPAERATAARRVRRVYGLEKPFVLYVSRIEHPGKNHVRLISAFGRLKERYGLPHQLVLGGGEWCGADAVQAAAVASKHAAAIRFLGYVPDEDVPDLYRAADLVVFPSLYEGFGLPVLEAMACGVPVACSNLSSLPEVAGDAAALFDPYDEDSMVGAMWRLLDDAAARRDAVQRGLARASQYSWGATAARTLDVLRGNA